MQADRRASLSEISAGEPSERGRTALESRRRRRTGRLVATAATAFAVDVATKALVVEGLQNRAPLRLLGGAVYLLHTRNTGAAFSLGQGYTIVLSLFAIGVVGYITRIARTLRSAGWAVSLGLILGGALGNLTDRIFRAPGVLRGGVVDFVSLFSDSGRVWPVFNVADSCLVIGACLLVILVFRGVRPDGTRVPAENTRRPQVPDSSGE